MSSNRKSRVLAVLPAPPPSNTPHATSALPRTAHTQVYSVPLVGIWVRGIRPLDHPLVYAACLKFRFSSVLPDRCGCRRQHNTPLRACCLLVAWSSLSLTLARGERGTERHVSSLATHTCMPYAECRKGALLGAWLRLRLQRLAALHAGPRSHCRPSAPRPAVPASSTNCLGAHRTPPIAPPSVCRAVQQDGSFLLLMFSGGEVMGEQRSRGGAIRQRGRLPSDRPVCGGSVPRLPAACSPDPPSPSAAARSTCASCPNVCYPGARPLPGRREPHPPLL